MLISVLPAYMSVWGCLSEALDLEFHRGTSSRMPGIEPRPLGRADSALNCWTISLAPMNKFLTFLASVYCLCHLSTSFWTILYPQVTVCIVVLKYTKLIILADLCPSYFLLPLTSSGPQIISWLPLLPYYLRLHTFKVFEYIEWHYLVTVKYQWEREDMPHDSLLRGKTFLSFVLLMYVISLFIALTMPVSSLTREWCYH